MRDVFAEKYHVRLHPLARTKRAVWHLKACFECRVKQRVTVRRLHCIDAGQIRILLFHQLLNRIAIAALATIQTQHAVQAAVQFDHIMTAGLIVQSVDVLRDQAADPAMPLQTGQRLMRCIRLRLTHPRPAQHRPRPVAAA